MRDTARTGSGTYPHPEPDPSIPFEQLSPEDQEACGRLADAVTTETLTPAKWLSAACDHIEAVAKNAGRRPWKADESVVVEQFSTTDHPIAETVQEEIATHIALHDPAAVLAQTKADRELIAEWKARRGDLAPSVPAFDKGTWEGMRAGVQFAIENRVRAYRHLAPVVPGFREEWR